MKLRIVNSMDRPCPRLVAEERADGLLYYIHPDIRDNKSYHGMSAAEATPLEHFGFEVEVHPGFILCVQVRKSTATYPSGASREWQGNSYFTIDLPTV
jgi:hypothetical protein